MRKAIKEYIEYSDVEKASLWNNATFVFDTNVFLNLYRYSNKTREQLFDSFKHLGNRIWMPYQVAIEFCKDRYKTIEEANKRFETMKTEAEKLVNDWKEKLHPDNNDINELNNYLNEWIKKEEECNYTYYDVRDDEIFNKLLDLFAGRTGSQLDPKDFSAIEKEGEGRYAQKIPPGYKDNKKVDNKYGDLLVWKEIIRYAKEKSVDVVFVTHDQKEDWWNICSGKTIGPRIELRKEFDKETDGHMFHMYTMSSFLSLFIEHKEKTVDRETIDEVENITSRTREAITWNEYTDYYDYLGEVEKEEVKRLENKISNLSAKNNKRKKSITALSKKAKKELLSDQENIALMRNKQNLKEDERLIYQFQERILRLIQQCVESVE